MRRFVRRFAWPFLIAAVVVGGWLYWRRPVEVRVAELERGPVTTVAFGRGTIESEREAAVGFELSGRVDDVLVDEGSHVKRGQVLAKLESRQAEADWRVARTSVGAARATLERLAAEEKRASALLAAAQREAERTSRLLANGAVAGQQRDDADDRLRVARADLDRVLAQRTEATRGIEVASSGADQREVTVLRSTLLAPFDGVVTKRFHEPGDTVAVGSAVLRIGDTSRLHVRAALDETALRRLAVGQQTEVLFPGDPVPVRGTVEEIAWEADRQTREILVDVVLERVARRVAIGQRADVRIELERRERVLRIPIAMLHHDAAGPYVFVDRDNRIAVARVVLGISGIEHVEVAAGLVEGDRLLAATSAREVLPTGRRWKAK